MSEKKRNLGIRATYGRWKELNHLATNRNTSVQKLVDDAIDAAYFSEPGKSLTPPDNLTSLRETASTADDDDSVTLDAKRTLMDIREAAQEMRDMIQGSARDAKGLSNEAFGDFTANIGRRLEGYEKALAELQAGVKEANERLAGRRPATRRGSSGRGQKAG